MKIVTLVFFLILAGCAASPERLESVGRSESARLAPPTKRFSNYATYELKRMVLSEAVRSDEAKVEVAGDLENVLRAKLQPLIDKWKAAPAGDRTGMLVIEPQLVSLRVISGGARFWVGPFMGDSTVDMDLLITEQGTAQQVAKPRITRNADAMAGSWSIGQSDQNLLDYIASIAYHYMTDNY